MLGCLCASTVCFAGVSTCESRVDAAKNKTTADRIEACLNEEDVTAETTPATEVLISETYSVQYSKRKTKKQPQQEPQAVKVYKPQPVSTSYTQRPDYPTFRNDTLPQLNDEEANAVTQEALKEQAARNAEKPAKKMKAAPKPARKSKASAPAKTQTPPQEIQQAQAIQNDPLAPAQDNTLPSDFDESLMDPVDFGDNATDPAFQK